MNHQLWAFVALDLAQRRAEAASNRRASLDLDLDVASPSSLRQLVARGLAAVSRSVAAIVRKLDDCVADDLGRSLAPTD